MLIDEIEFKVKAGDGGEGIVSFGKLRKSGPDGGNGGKGGDLYLKTSSDLTLLSRFLSETLISAEDGRNGSKDKKAGKAGEDYILEMPLGSLIKDQSTGEVFELTKVGEELLFCKGGAGGTGNFDLRSSRNTTPLETKPAQKGQKRNLHVILRFIADYGLIGLPSAGKSSLLNELTNTKVKTAEYHFTTLSPNLGVLPNKKIIADIPGLIEGASQGRGLGTKFLKHIQKVSLLLHCISAESIDPLHDYLIIRNELKNFDSELLNKKEIILITKSDLVDPKPLQNTIAKLKKVNKNILITSIHHLDSINALLKIL